MLSGYKKAGVYFLLTWSMIFWSLSFIWYKDAYLYFKPITTIFFRLVISAVFLFFLSLSLKELQKVKLKDFKYFLIAAFFEPFIYFIGESFGMQLVSSSMAAVIIALIPLFSPFAGYIFLKEKVSPANILGILLSIIGIIFIIFHHGFHLQAPLKGIMLMFLAVCAAIGYSIMIRKIAYKYNSFTIVTYQNMIGSLLFAPLFFILDFDTVRQTTYTLANFKAIFELAIFASSFAFVFFAYSIRHIGVTKANTFTNIIPVFTAILAYFLLNEELGLNKIMGTFLVIVGLFLSQIDISKLKILAKTHLKR
ncbi:MAG: DMT family transporter [Bacteroidota bacterium]|nr:DMT family transporter [Bacteroidota bacterium]MDP4274217.1 DMT family transporter [Bacteroidota bacterium]